MAFNKPAISKAIQKGNHAFNIVNIRNHCYTKIADLKAEAILSDEPIKYKDLDKYKFEPIHRGQAWAKKYGCAWFHFYGQVPEKGKGKHVALRIKIQGEGLVFNQDGIITQGITQIVSKGDVFHSLVGKQVVDVSDCSNGDEVIDIKIDAGFNGKLRFKKLKAHFSRADICIVNDEEIGYYYDYIDLYFLMINLDKNSTRFKEIDAALNNSYKIYRSKGVSAAREAIKVAMTPIDYPATEFTSIGHAHIDLAWLWPIRETKRKVARTFANQLRNLKRYNEFVFAESQPQMWTWLKEEYPDLYARVKEQVMAGRIELQGKNWVENDCNLTSGESWVRQSLYGDKFWKQEFGKDVNMCWLPDVFGFPASLPQVFRKCEMDYFMTIKLLSNTVNEFPYKTFNWVGIDGTPILAHMEPLGDYNSGASPFAIFKSNKRNSEKEICPKALLIYGDGDGGGGPGEGHIEYVLRHKNLNGLAPCKMRKAVEFFDDINDIKDILPTHHGELYYERHQGCYTSQANSKKANKAIENLLHKVELLGAYAFTKGISYDRQKVEEIWKEVLLYQFHDILPGTSIKRVYTESLARYEVLTQELREIELDLINKLTTKDGIVCLNPVDMKRHEFIKINDEWNEINIDKNSTSSPTKLEEKKYDFKFNDYMIENELLRVTFDIDGVITSVLDKKNNKELVKEYFNKLMVFSDPFMFYNAWDIDMNYREMKKWQMKLKSSKVYIDGPTIIRENTFTYNKSKLVQKISLTTNDYLINFDTTVIWDEEYKLLKAEFTPTIYNDDVICNIQYGNFKRSTREDNSVEKAQFEICAQKFVELEDKQQNYGLALINNGKYGHRVKNGLLSLSLLRAPVFPDPTCDRGVHNFSYAIYPHASTFDDSDVMQRAYLYNYNVEVINRDLSIENMVSFDKDNIIIETFKVSENEDGIIVRCYESLGKETQTTMSTSFNYSAIQETTILENKPVDIGKEMIFKPYEIKTILLKK